MANDRDRPFAAGDITSLNPRSGVFSCLLIGPLPNTNSFQTNRYPGDVHHSEHVLQAAILFADYIADSASLVAVRQHAGGTAVNAELVLHGKAECIIPGSQRAVVIDQKFWDDK